MGTQIPPCDLGSDLSQSLGQEAHAPADAPISSSEPLSGEPARRGGRVGSRPWELGVGNGYRFKLLHGGLSQQREEPETAERERGREHPRAQMGESAFSTPPSPWAES